MTSCCLLQAWGNPYPWGSDNTAGGYNWYVSGVPMNIAYQPTAMLSVDIGVPVVGLPTGATPMVYMMHTQAPRADYTVIGNTAATMLTNAELDPSGSVAVTPTYTYFLQQSGSTGVPGLPSEGVLARRFTKGLVLLRVDTWGGSASFLNSMSPSIALGGSYCRVSFDGSLSSPVTSVVLGGYEGAIFVTC